MIYKRCEFLTKGRLPRIQFSRKTRKLFSLKYRSIQAKLYACFLCDVTARIIR